MPSPQPLTIVSSIPLLITAHPSSYYGVFQDILGVLGRSLFGMPHAFQPHPKVRYEVPLKRSAKILFLNNLNNILDYTLIKVDPSHVKQLKVDANFRGNIFCDSCELLDPLDIFAAIQANVSSFLELKQEMLFKCALDSTYDKFTMLILCRHETHPGYHVWLEVVHQKFNRQACFLPKKFLSIDTKRVRLASPNTHHVDCIIVHNSTLPVHHHKHRIIGKFHPLLFDVLDERIRHRQIKGSLIAIPSGLLGSQKAYTSHQPKIPQLVPKLCRTDSLSLLDCAAFQGAIFSVKLRIQVHLEVQCLDL